MNETINIRAHHLLCLPGYKGNGYDGEHKTSWDTISQTLKETPDTFVKIIDGKDDLCKNCPNSKGINGIKCHSVLLEKLDNKVKDMLNVSSGSIYTWQELMKKVFGIMNGDKHEKLCGDCSWRTMGLCEDTFKKEAA